MSIDLDAYLVRIGLTRADVERCDLAALDAIVWAHLHRIPFENLDIVLDRPIRIDDASVFAKLVTARRGGYCFEHNTLLAGVLRELGFEVTALSARVLLGEVPSPRTHMLLEVPIAGQPHLVDVGFGGQCPTRAVPLVMGEHDTRHGRLRITTGPHEFFELAMAVGDGWQPLYGFTREPHVAVDFEVANHYTSTHPDSRFRLGPIAAVTTDTGRVSYARGELTYRAGDTVERKSIIDAEHLLEVLDVGFHLTFAPGTRFRGGPG